MKPYNSGILDKITVGVLLVALGILLGMPLWTMTSAETFQLEAIKHGVAHFVTNPQTGARTFEWIEPKGGEE